MRNDQKECELIDWSTFAWGTVSCLFSMLQFCRIFHEAKNNPFYYISGSSNRNDNDEWEPLSGSPARAGVTEVINITHLNTDTPYLGQLPYSLPSSAIRVMQTSVSSAQQRGGGVRCSGKGTDQASSQPQCHRSQMCSRRELSWHSLHLHMGEGVPFFFLNLK